MSLVEMFCTSLCCTHSFSPAYLCCNVKVFSITAKPRVCWCQIRCSTRQNLVTSSISDTWLIHPLLFRLTLRSLIIHPLIFIFTPHPIWCSTFFVTLAPYFFSPASSFSAAFGLMSPWPSCLYPLLLILIVPIFLFFDLFLAFFPLWVLFKPTH